MPADVGIVGGGPAGLLSAVVLSKLGYDVEVYEEHENIGKPRHCTGLISDTSVNMLKNLCNEVSRSWIVRSFKEYIIRDTKRTSTIYLRFAERVFITDREIFEQDLRDIALSKGARISLRSHVDVVRKDGCINILNELRHYRLIVLAEGSVRYHSLMLGLCSKRNNLKGIQAITRPLDFKVDIPVIYVGKDLSKDFFGWAVPYRDRELIIGYADRKVSLEGLKHLIKILIRDSGGTAVTIKKFFGGLIPADKPCKPVTGKVIGLGDSISSVKPISGGGVYPILAEAIALRRSLESELKADHFADQVAPILARIKRQHTLKVIIKKLGGYEGILKLLNKVGLKYIELSNYDLLKPNVLHSLANLLKH